MGGFERRSAGREREGVGGQDRVSSAGDVHGLIATVDRDMREARGRFEQCHAIAAAGDEQGLQLHGGKSGATAAGELFEILADRSVMQGFEFGFVGGCRGEAGFCVGGESVASIERNDHGFAF